MKKRILSEYEINTIINLFNDGVSVKGIYNSLGVSPQLIKKLLINNGFNVKSLRTHSVNESIFNVVDTEEKAYWLGFLFADGSIRYDVRKGTYSVRLWLSTKDETHVVKFKKFLETEAPIKYRISKIKYKSSISISEGVGIDVSSKIMVGDLINLGCVPNKTFRINKPNIKEDYFRHFIRGYFDGDGCISLKKSNMGKTIDFSSSSELILRWISDIFKTIDVSFSELYKVKNHHRLYNSKIKDIGIIYNYFYKDSNIYLNRKKEKFEEIIEFFSPKKVKQINVDGTIKKMWEDVTFASQITQIKKNLILKCCNNEIKYAGGFKWEFDN